MSRLMYASPSWSGYLNVEYVSTIQKLFTRSVKWGVTGKSYQAVDIFDVRDEKLFSAMCNWSNHCLHHLLPSECDTGHDLIGVEDILISWFAIILALLGVASLFVCCMIHCKHLRLSDANKHSYLLTYLLTWYFRVNPAPDVAKVIALVKSTISRQQCFKFRRVCLCWRHT